MKHFGILLLLFLALGTASSSAQVIVKDTTIAIFPYFSKNDTMTYYRDDINYTVNGKDTTYTMSSTTHFMVICKKADDNTGYTVEETYLETEIDSTIYDGANTDTKAKIHAELQYALAQAYEGMKIEYTMDAKGENLRVVNPDKVIKELTERAGKGWDIFSASNPIITKIINKDAYMDLVSGAFSDPETLLDDCFDEMTQLFEMHGNAWTIDQHIQSSDNDNPAYTRPSEFELVVTAEPEEGKEIADWDDYVVVGRTIEYFDSEKMALENAKKLDESITLDQLKEFMGDKMPKGEVENIDYNENHYFGDGWPKELTHINSNIQLDSGEETTEVHHIEWDARSVGNTQK